MSGGHFGYSQYQIREIADDIERLIKKNKVEDEWGYARNYPDAVIEEFKNGVKILHQAEIYAQRIDWLVCGDDGEETFIKRLKEELKEEKNAKSNNNERTIRRITDSFEKDV